MFARGLSRRFQTRNHCIEIILHSTHIRMYKYVAEKIFLPVYWHIYYFCLLFVCIERAEPATSHTMERSRKEA